MRRICATNHLVSTFLGAVASSLVHSKRLQTTQYSENPPEPEVPEMAGSAFRPKKNPLTDPEKGHEGSSTPPPIRDPLQEMAEENLSPEEKKEKLVAMMLAKDREILELKRIHELSLIRVKQMQDREKRDAEDATIFGEENVDRTVLDTVSNTQHTKKNVLGHALGQFFLRRQKAVAVLVVTVALNFQVYRWYVLNPKRKYASGDIIHTGHGRQYRGEYDTRVVYVDPKEQKRLEEELEKKMSLISNKEKS